MCLIGKLNWRYVFAGIIEDYEYRPAPQIQYELMDCYNRIDKAVPSLSFLPKQCLLTENICLYGRLILIRARSILMNTEVGVLIHNRDLAVVLVEQSIKRDMASVNSWNVVDDNPDNFASRGKRLKVFSGNYCFLSRCFDNGFGAFTDGDRTALLSLSGI